MIKDDNLILNHDIKLLKSFLLDDYLNLESSNLTSFECGDFIYPWTNENLKESYEKDLVGKKVLNVTSSGDHILHSLLSGAADIYSFDINHFCKYYAALKIAMIKKYSKEEFFNKMINWTECFTVYQNEDNTGQELLQNILCDVSLYLSLDERRFWTYFIKFSKKFKYNDGLFVNSYYSEHIISYLIDENYYKLKDILVKGDYRINYLDSDICNLTNNVKDSFDYIHLSNIIGRINENMDKIKILISLKNILNKDGIICDYDFNSNKKYELEYILKCFYDVKHLSLNNNYSLHILRKK